MSLFGPLPPGDGLERVDIPANERGQRDLRRTLLRALYCFCELRLILELYLTVPAQVIAAERCVNVFASR